MNKKFNVKIDIPFEIGLIHFVGIGGIGMSGIAEIMHNLGYNVQGSDLSSSKITERLESLGIKFFHGHKKENIDNVKAIVISTAVKSDNVELVEARKKRIPVVKRQDMLAELMRLKWNICVAGTHGKTTTTSIVSTILDEANFDATVINGGIINSYGTNARLGMGNWMVVEADESDGTFIKLPSVISIITNMDPEHMEYFGSQENLRKAFDTFIEKLPVYGFGIVCLDHPEVQGLYSRVIDRKIYSFGENPQSDFQILNIRYDGRFSEFDLEIKSSEGKKLVKDFKIPMPGKYNVLNATAAICVGIKLGIKEDVIKNALLKFDGVKRRFTFVGEHKSISFIDDYAHHPVEINSLLKAAKQVSKGKIIAIMQPHRYSRLQYLFEDFAKSMNEADCVIITPVYEAGEKPIEGINSESLVEKMINSGHRNVNLLRDYADLPKMICKFAKENDYIIGMGAGDISKRMPEILLDFKKIYK